MGLYSGRIIIAGLYANGNLGAYVRDNFYHISEFCGIRKQTIPHENTHGANQWVTPFWGKPLPPWVNSLHSGENHFSFSILPLVCHVTSEKNHFRFSIFHLVCRVTSKEKPLPLPIYALQIFSFG